MTAPRPANLNMLWAHALADELARCGVRDAAASPGSRSAPLALALARHPAIALRVILDERSAGYFAVGLAKATGRPAVVATTSGTAAANLLPAVVEADQAGVPLLALTADRPPELVDVGANQAIRQPGLFGRAVRWECGLPVPEATPAALRHLRQSACRAAAFAAAGPVPGGPGSGGPVHVNVPFREPLAPVPGDEAGLAALEPHPLALHGRADGAPFLSIAPRPAAAPGRMAFKGGRGLVVLGPGAPSLSSTPAARALRAWPVVADPLAADPAAGLPGADAFLSSAALRQALRPDWVLHLGASPTSKPVRAYLAEHQDRPRCIVDPSGRAWDDLHGASHAVPAVPEVDAPADAAWAARWREASAAATALAPREDDWEGPVPDVLLAARPALLWAGSSLPVRDLDRFATAWGGGTRILANRGASGIDGVVSSAAGAASALGAAGRCMAYVGDLSFLHDVGGLAAVRRHAPHLTVVVLNNGGGRIFEHLPVAESVPRQEFERLFATPQDVDLAAACAAFGLPHARLRGTSRLGAALAEPRGGVGGVVEVCVDAAVAVRRRKAHLAAVAAAADRLAAGWADGAPEAAGPGQRKREGRARVRT